MERISATDLEAAAGKAIAGDKDALNDLVSALQNDLFGLSLRMLGIREDAEDATQEILIRIITRLSQFDFRSKLKTWGLPHRSQLYPRRQEKRVGTDATEL
jgi:DNA-directed RNA polymerase specialized sigma24 family protein